MIQEDFSKYDLSSLEYCTTAGEAMNPSVAETFQKLTGVQIYEGFGQTETTMTLGTFPWIKPNQEAWASLTHNMMFTFFAQT